MYVSFYMLAQHDFFFAVESLYLGPKAILSRANAQDRGEARILHARS
jgi:hypothetical protein